MGTPSGTGAHVCVQEPQWAGSAFTSMQLDPQRVSPVAQPLVQPLPPPGSAEHSGAVPPQTVPHAPQLAGRLRSVSQPSVALALQSPKPAMHAMPHEIPLQVALAFERAGHAVHEVVPHVVTEALGAHAPPHRW